VSRIEGLGGVEGAVVQFVQFALARGVLDAAQIERALDA